MMPRYEVAIATRNPKVRYLAVNLLNRLGIKFILCAPDDRRCDKARAIVTTEIESAYFDSSRVVVGNEALDPDATAIAIMFKLLDIKGPSNITIGIDPGMKYGLALVADGVTVYSETALSPKIAVNDTLHWVAIVREAFQNPIQVRVGTGSKLYSALYLRGFSSQTNGLEIEMVDERYTTRIGESDQSSAALIASRKGRQITDEDLLLELKEGYIRSLKRLATRLTEGRRKLTSAEARSVLLDEISIEEILDVTYQESAKKVSTC